MTYHAQYTAILPIDDLNRFLKKPTSQNAIIIAQQSQRIIEENDTSLRSIGKWDEINPQMSIYESSTMFAFPDPGNCEDNITARLFCSIDWSRLSAPSKKTKQYQDIMAEFMSIDNEYLDLKEQAILRAYTGMLEYFSKLKQSPQLFLSTMLIRNLLTILDGMEQEITDIPTSYKYRNKAIKLAWAIRNELTELIHVISKAESLNEINIHQMLNKTMQDITQLTQTAKSTIKCDQQDMEVFARISQPLLDHVEYISNKHQHMLKQMKTVFTAIAGLKKIDQSQLSKPKKINLAICSNQLISDAKQYCSDCSNAMLLPSHKAEAKIKEKTKQFKENIVKTIKNTESELIVHRHPQWIRAVAATIKSIKRWCLSFVQSTEESAQSLLSTGSMFNAVNDKTKSARLAMPALNNIGCVAGSGLF